MAFVPLRVKTLASWSW